MEEWRSVVGLESYYMVSSLGRVRSIPRDVPNTPSGSTRRVRERILKTYTHSAGYVAIKLSVNMKRHSNYIHRLVCEAWHGPEPEGCEVMHLDGNKKNNVPDNLKWGTRQENIIDNGRHGVLPIGTTHGMAMLTEAQVLAIRADSRGYKRLAKVYGCTPSNIHRIKKRLSWKHI
jgi:hypothetical protein